MEGPRPRGRALLWPDLKFDGAPRLMDDTTMVTALFVAVLWLLAPSAPFRHAATRRWARQVAFHRLPTARYASGSNSNGGTGTATTTTTTTTTANTDAADATTVSEDELDALMSIALGEEYYKELNAKVAAAKQDEWDVRQGVNPSRTKPLPLKANLDLWTYTARGQLLKGNFTAAEQLYNKCVDYDPCDGRAWLGLARLQWKKGQALAAEKCYKDGLYYSPNNPFLLQGWAVMLEKLGKIPQATKLLTKSVRANPRHSASWVALGRLHQRAGKVDEARYCFSSAVDGDPRSYVALQAWGVLEAETGNAQAARGLFQRAVDASGGRSVHALQAWATLEKKAGNLDEAEKLLEQAVKAWPESTRVRLSMAELHELRGDGARARETFQKAQRKAEARGDAGFFQAWALFELRQRPDTYAVPSPVTVAGIVDAAGTTTGGAGDGAAPRQSVATEQAHATARRLFKKAVTINKYHSASWVAWAKHEQKAGNLDVARRLLITGISNFPHSRNIGWFYAGLASLARQDGDVGTARACYDRALAATAPQKALQLLLDFAKMEAYDGEKDNALKLFELTVKRFPTVERAWDDYVDYAAYLTGERERHRSLEASAESAAAAAAASAAAAAAAVGDAGGEAAPAVAVAVAVAAPPRYSGLVQSLLDRKEAAMGPGYVARKRRQKAEEEDDDSALDDGDDGESRAVSGAGARAASLSFTVEDSDALDNAWETADSGGDDDDGDDGIRPLPSLLDTDDGDAAGGESSSSGWEGLGIGVDVDGRSGVFDDEFLDKFLRSRGDRNRGGGSGMSATLPADVDKAAPVLGSLPSSSAAAAAAAAAAAVDPESRSRAVDAALSQLLRGPLPTTADTDPDTDIDTDTAADT